MKKLLLLAAFSAAGLVSANTIYEEMNSFEYQVAEDARFDFSIVESDHYWITVETWCGRVFYLDGNHYGNIHQFNADANYFTDQQCGPF